MLSRTAEDFTDARPVLGTLSSLTFHGVVLGLAFWGAALPPDHPRTAHPIVLGLPAPAPAAALPSVPSLPGAPPISGTAVPDTPPLLEITLGSGTPVAPLPAWWRAREGRSILGEGAAQGGESEILTFAMISDPPAPRMVPRPVYPEALRVARIAGRVSLEFVVDTLGRVEPASVRTLMASDSAFGDAAVRAIKGAIFFPGRSGGVARRVLVRQVMVFQIGP